MPQAGGGVSCTYPRVIPSHLAGGQPSVPLGCDEAMGDAIGFIALEAAYPGEHKVPAPVKQCQASSLEANCLELELFPMSVFNFIFLWKDY